MLFRETSCKHPFSAWSVLDFWLLGGWHRLRKTVAVSALFWAPGAVCSRLNYAPETFFREKRVLGLAF
jgi:hypothetical protein